MAMRVVLVSGAVLALMASPVLADDEVVVAANRAPVPAASASASTQVEAAPAARPEDDYSEWYSVPVRRGSDAPVSTGQRDRGLHGSAGASIGTNGYKSAYVTTLIPVGDEGVLGIGLSHTEFGSGSGRGPMSHGGSHDSLSILLDMSGQSGEAFTANSFDCEAYRRRSLLSLQPSLETPEWRMRERTC